MGKSSQPPSTPTRIPRPSSPTGGASPTRSNPRRGIGILQAVGRGDIFRGASRAEGIGRIGVWPLNTSVAESHGYSVGPMRPAAHQSSIPPPLNATYQQNPQRPTTSRGPSSTTTTGSPESQLTYGYTSVTTSTSPEGVAGVRQAQLTGNSAITSPTMSASEAQGGINPYSPSFPPRITGSSLPIRLAPPRPPPEPRDDAYTGPNAWAGQELNYPKLPPGASDDSLRSKHRDSLRLASVQSIPRLTPPGTKKGDFSEFFAKENPDSPQSDGPQAPVGQNSGVGSQASRESSVFEDWPIPVELLKDSSELENVEETGTKESPEEAQKDDTEQEIVQSQDDIAHHEDPTQEGIEKVDVEKQGGEPSLDAKKDCGEGKCCCDKKPVTNESSMGIESLIDDSFRLELSGDSAPRDTQQRTDWLCMPQLTEPQNLQSEGGSGSPTKTSGQQSQLPRPTQKAGGEKGSGLQRSRTRTVLSNLTTSLSRASLSSFRIHPRRHTPSAMATPYEDDSPALTEHPSNEHLVQPDASSRSHHLDNVRLIYEAQDAEWWTGRFQALDDHFRNENLSPENMATIIASATKIPGPASRPQNPAGLPSSHTMGNFPSSSAATTASAQRERAALLTDEDARAKRVFGHLNTLCMTDAARKSLYAFQQQYARNHDKEALLPSGGTMYDEPKGKGKRWVGRIFSGRDKDKDKDGGKKGGPSH
ncbi:hypothetical protein F4805DRAFT_456467 [Annulohypoxylon moriforme]|nr:hypothetical protein F4805DRAFT_456467 [Annulohypoxylon moriforme]